MGTNLSTLQPGFEVVPCLGLCIVASQTKSYIHRTFKKLVISTNACAILSNLLIYRSTALAFDPSATGNPKAGAIPLKA